MIDYGKKGYKIALFAMVLALLAFSIGGSTITYFNNSTCLNCTNGTNGLNGTNGIDGINGSNIIEYFYPSNVTKVYGGTLTGNITGFTAHDDNNFVKLIETTGSSNALTLNITWTSPDFFDSVIIYGGYFGGSTHYINVKFWDSNDSTWHSVCSLPATTANDSYLCAIPDPEHHINGNTTMQLEHVGSGNVNHYLLLDYVALRHGGSAGNPNTGLINTKLNISGGNMTGILNMTNNNITDVNTISINNGITLNSSLLSYNYSISNILSDGLRPIVLSLNISSSSGTNNATHIYTSGHTKTDFSDLNITQNGIPLNFCLEENSTTGKNRLHINITDNGSVIISYGNPSNTSQQDCSKTYIQYRGYSSISFNNSTQSRTNNMQYESIVTGGSGSSNLWWGIGKELADNPVDGIVMKLAFAFDNTYGLTYNNSAGTAFTTGGGAVGQSYRFMFRRYNNQVDFYRNDTYLFSSTTNLPDESIGIGFNIFTSTGNQTWSYLAPWYSSASSWSDWGTEQVITTISPIRTWCLRADYNGNLITTWGSC